MSNRPVNEHALFPYLIKYLGIILLITTCIVVLWYQTEFGIKSLLPFGTMQIIIRISFLISLFLIASSREKDEDELVGLLRLKSFEWSFRWGILYTIVDLAIPANAIELSGFSLIFSMLIVYLMVFYFKKKEQK